jgi:hypothetical protein
MPQKVLFGHIAEAPCQKKLSKDLFLSPQYAWVAVLKLYKKNLVSY